MTNRTVNLGGHLDRAMRKRVLWVGDAACPSGFGRATHEILDTVRYDYNVAVLGLNYRGAPHTYRPSSDNPDGYEITPANIEDNSDIFGVKAIVAICDEHRPDIIVIQNDGWNIQGYIRHLRLKRGDGSYYFKEHAQTPVIAAVAVDGRNFNGAWLNGVDHAIFWTQFALDEARNGGYAGAASVIPLGVDTRTFHPVDRLDARSRVLPRCLDRCSTPDTCQSSDTAFIVGNVNRNQPRKRLDLTVRYFATWVRKYGIKDAYLFLHVAPTGDHGYDIASLARYYGIARHVITQEPPTWHGRPDSHMVDTYNSFDLQITTTQGEGFGFTTFEGMACGVPQIVPAWSALEELTKDAAWQVKCPTTSASAPQGHMSVIGGVADEDSFVHALNVMYENRHYREQNSKAGLERVNEDRFKWPVIGRQYSQLIGHVLEQTADTVINEEVTV